jgi:predicted DNA-binding antitoxin AbrB/MazE fold protein
MRGGESAMQTPIEVVYENGVLRPLEPLPYPVQEHQRLTVRIDMPSSRADRLDVTCITAAKRSADPSVSLDEVRRILAKVPGSLAEAVHADREER